MKDADYLIKAWYLSCQAQTSRTELEKGFSQTRQLGLTLFANDEERVPNEGFVSFVVRFNDNNRPGVIAERSRLSKESGQWYYINGTRPLIGHNDPYLCGSGKKFKKCYGQ